MKKKFLITFLILCSLPQEGFGDKLGSCPDIRNIQTKNGKLEFAGFLGNSLEHAELWKDAKGGAMLFCVYSSKFQVSTAAEIPSIYLFKHCGFDKKKTQKECFKSDPQECVVYCDLIPE